MSLYQKSKKPHSRESWIRLSLIPLILVVILLVVYYQQTTLYSATFQDEQSATVIISKNYGTTLLMDTQVSITAGDTAMDVLHQLTTVGSSYGNAFVTSINELESRYNQGNGEKVDWFYFINGMLGNIGAHQYQLHPGDIERWDYHDWSTNIMTTAIIGDFPEPFLHGFNGNIADTIIAYEEQYEPEAQTIQDFFNDYQIDSTIVEISSLSPSQKQTAHIVLIASADHALIQDLVPDARQLGWFIDISSDYLQTYAEDGLRSTNYDSGGCIISTQNPWNPKGNWHCENVLWILSGTSSEGISQTVHMFTTHPEQIKHAANVIVYQNSVIKVP